jgi:hypothetical protein
MKTFLTFALFAGVLGAQTMAPTTAGNNTGAPAAIAGLPAYFVSAGYGLSPSPSIATATQNQEAWASAAIQIGANSPYYSVTTMDITPSSYAIRMGFARVMAQSGPVTLLARIDAGISTGTPTISSFSAGGIVTYKLPKFSNVYGLFELRLTANPAGSAGTVQAGLYVGIGWGH